VFILRAKLRRVKITSMNDEQYHLTDVFRLDKRGRKIYGFICLICTHTFTNHKNAVAHCAQCKAEHLRNAKIQNHKIEELFGSSTPQAED
jgi:hypothetical protein